jgi:glycosyltransferase involved in cell wall biosynthesis
LANPLVTVITPVYNQVRFIQETIESVLAQDYGNIEYIIVDGGSEDGTLEIIRKYEDQVSIIISEPDGGQSEAINKGYRLARGEIVAWLNGDDLYFPWSVSSAVARFISNPELAITYGHSIHVDDKGNFLRYFHQVEEFNRFRLLNCTNFISQPTTFIKREKLIEVGLLCEDLHFTMDYDLWCRFAKAGMKFEFIPMVIAANREYGKTKTKSGGKQRMKEIWKCWRTHGTSFWPHGFWGFLHETNTNRNAHSKHLFSKISVFTTRILAVLFGLKNYLSYCRLKSRTIEGFDYLNRLVGASSRILIPTPTSKVNLIELKFKNMNQISIQIPVNSKKCNDIQRNGSNHNIRISCKGYSNYIEIKIIQAEKNSALRLSKCELTAR